MRRADVAIIIVTYNSGECIGRCLDSLNGQKTTLKRQIVVVDNNSTDDTVQIIRDSYAHVNLVPADENLGFAAGVNYGVRFANAEFILLLNPDATVAEDAIDKLVGFARKNPSYGVYGGKAIKTDKSLEPSSCWAFPTLWSMAMFSCGLSTVFPANRWTNPESMPHWKRDTIREVDVVSGCFLLTTMHIWTELGGLDERFFMYGEDVDFGFRVRAAGYRSVVCPSAVVTHEIGASSSTRASMMQLLYRGKATLVRTHWHGIARYTALALLVLGTGLRAGIGKLRLPRFGRSAEGWADLWRTRRQWIAGY